MARKAKPKRRPGGRSVARKGNGAAEQEAPALEITASRQFPEWLAERGAPTITTGSSRS